MEHGPFTDDVPIENGNSIAMPGTDKNWRYLCKGISQWNMVNNMVLTYLHVLDLEDLPLGDDGNKRLIVAEHRWKTSRDVGPSSDVNVAKNNTKHISDK